MKRWMQGIGLIYILLLLGICVPGAAGGNAQNDTGETLYLIRSERTKKETDKKMEKPKIALTFDDGPNAQFTGGRTPGGQSHIQPCGDHAGEQ